MRLRQYVYDFLKMIEKNNSNDDDENNINKGNGNVQKGDKNRIILFILEQLNNNLFLINKKEINIEAYDFSKNPYSYCKSFERNNFYIIILKYFISIQDNMLERDYCRLENSKVEALFRFRSNRFQKQRIEIEKSVNDYIIEYIKNGFQETQNQKQPIKTDYPNIYFNCINYKESEEDEFVEISIKIFIFDIKIKMPFNKRFNSKNYFNKIHLSLERNIILFNGILLGLFLIYAGSTIAFHIPPFGVNSQLSC